MSNCDHLLSTARQCQREGARKPQRGFTLIELMIGLAIVGILTAIAMPIYMDSIRKNRRSEGIAALSQLQQAQERWRANASTYTTELTTALPNGLGLPATTGAGYYAIAVTAADANSYTATATAQTGTSQASDTNCRMLGVRMTGGNIRYGAGASSVDWTASDADALRCWAR